MGLIAFGLRNLADAMLKTRCWKTDHLIPFYNIPFLSTLSETLWACSYGNQICKPALICWGVPIPTIFQLQQEWHNSGVDSTANLTRSQFCPTTFSSDYLFQVEQRCRHIPMLHAHAHVHNWPDPPQGSGFMLLGGSHMGPQSLPLARSIRFAI